MVAHARPLNTKAWVDRVTTWKNAYPITMFKHEGVTAEKVIETINRLFKHSVVATDVGQNQLWATQYVELDENRKLLTSGGLGTMGYGLPAAIGAQLGAPDRKVVCITGDGGMQMNIQEIATAVLYRLPIIVCILNNGYLGNVRQWQEMFFEGRYSMTCLMRREGCPHACKGPGDCCPQQYVPDFVKLAESYQAYGRRVTNVDDIEPVLREAAENTDAPTIIEFIIDRETNVLPMVPGGHALDEMIMED